ncbi:MAG: hypothetical protein PF448_01605 [Bacteroidales bacterium]|nr:hypothetical protein [Bacteroidales bacterium]
MPRKAEALSQEISEEEKTMERLSFGWKGKAVVIRWEKRSGENSNCSSSLAF